MLEWMAVHWTITGRLRLYLYGLSYIDNFVISHLIKSGVTRRRFARGSADLTEFNFSIYHIAGQKNIPSDLLSWSTTCSDKLRLDEAVCCLINIIAYQPSLPQMQKEDKFCQEIMNSNKESSPYYLDNRNTDKKREKIQFVYYRYGTENDQKVSRRLWAYGFETNLWDSTPQILRTESVIS